MLAVITGIEPRDQIEAMLAAQMAAVHMASMTFARRLAHVDNIPQQDSAERAFNKLTRTFAAQVSALKEYRSKGEQKMTVQHVHVAEGGQAIVGNVNAPAEGGGAREKSGEQPHALGYAPGITFTTRNQSGQVAEMSSAGGGKAGRYVRCYRGWWLEVRKGNKNAMKHGAMVANRMRREVQGRSMTWWRFLPR